MKTEIDTLRRALQQAAPKELARIATSCETTVRSLYRIRSGEQDPAFSLGCKLAKQLGLRVRVEW